MPEVVAPEAEVPEAAVPEAAVPVSAMQEAAGTMMTDSMYYGRLRHCLLGVRGVCI